MNHPPRKTQPFDARTALRSATPVKRIRLESESAEFDMEVALSAGLSLANIWRASETSSQSYERYAEIDLAHGARRLRVSMRFERRPEGRSY